MYDIQLTIKPHASLLNVSPFIKCAAEIIIVQQTTITFRSLTVSLTFAAYDGKRVKGRIAIKIKYAYKNKLIAAYLAIPNKTDDRSLTRL